MSCPNSTRTAFAKTVHSVTHRRTSKHSTSEFNFDAPGLDGTLFVNCSKECKAREASNRSAELVARKKNPVSQSHKNKNDHAIILYDHPIIFPLATTLP